MNRILPDVEAHKRLTMLQESPRKMRGKAIRLTELEKWTVATYCIENKCVMIDKEGKFTRYRMMMKHIVDEVTSLLGKKVNDYHIKDSMQFYDTICEITKLMPNIPAQDSAEEEVLKQELQRAQLVNDEMGRRNKALEMLYARTLIGIDEVAKKMERMFKEEFGVRK
jgi:hypothetical protein